MVAVTVVGANGRLGRLVVEHALTRGHEVTAAVRRPGSFDPVTPPRPHHRLRVVRADVLDAPSIGEAVSGAQVVVSAIAPAGVHPGGLYSVGTAGLVAAMEASHVDRFVCVSSGAVVADDRNIPFFHRGVIVPLFMRELYDDMREMERVVVGSSLRWTQIEDDTWVHERPTLAY